MGEEERLAGLLLEAIPLVATQPVLAIDKLDEVVKALEPHPDLADVQARALSMLAQACLAADELPRANEAAMNAMRLTRALGDDVGLRTIRELHEQIAAERDRAKRNSAARKTAAPLAARTLQDLEEQAGSALALADILIKHTGALRLTNQPDRAEASARRAIRAADEAGSVREQVLARIALAEVLPTSASTPLTEALALADGADETTLIGLVARAAELAKVALPNQHGPDNTPRNTP